jgi:hypothetical protein
MLEHMGFNLSTPEKSGACSVCSDRVAVLGKPCSYGVCAFAVYMIFSLLSTVCTSALCAPHPQLRRTSRDIYFVRACLPRFACSFVHMDAQMIRVHVHRHLIRRSPDHNARV